MVMWVFGGLLAVSIGWTGLYGLVTPPVTPLMLIREAAADDAAAAPQRRHTVVPLDAISAHLIKAVIASEDARFCHHWGIDPAALREVWREYQAGKGLRGASTITQQTAKNAFLWPEQDLVRKGLEAYFAGLIELGWSKRRILEVYLNIIEWGDGLYGAEAAAQAYFGVPASRLTATQASLMAVVLPNPRRWSPANPTAYIRKRARIIRARVADMEAGDWFDCW